MVDYILFAFLDTFFSFFPCSIGLIKIMALTQMGSASFTRATISSKARQSEYFLQQFCFT